MSDENARRYQMNLFCVKEVEMLVSHVGHFEKLACKMAV